jgi:DNA-binding FrmR family transcriptional regulator
MTHTIHHKPKLLAGVRRIRGQVEAIERAADTASLRHAQHRIVMRPVTTMRSIRLS